MKAMKYSLQTIRFIAHVSERWQNSQSASPANILTHYTNTHTHTHTTVKRAFVCNYPGWPVPEEIFTHSHPSWSSDILYHCTNKLKQYSTIFKHTRTHAHKIWPEHGDSLCTDLMPSCEHNDHSLLFSTFPAGFFFNSTQLQWPCRLANRAILQLEGWDLEPLHKSQTAGSSVCS